MELKIQVTVTPSLNKLHKNRWQMLNWKKRYLRELQGYDIYKLKKRVKMRVIYERYGSRTLDQENWFGGTKPLTDALKDLGLIVDDRQEWLEIEHRPQVKCKRGYEKTLIILEEAE